MAKNNVHPYSRTIGRTLTVGQKFIEGLSAEEREQIAHSILVLDYQRRVERSGLPYGPPKFTYAPLRLTPEAMEIYGYYADPI